MSVVSVLLCHVMSPLDRSFVRFHTDGMLVTKELVHTYSWEASGKMLLLVKGQGETRRWEVALLL